MSLQLRDKGSISYIVLHSQNKTLLFSCFWTLPFAQTCGDKEKEYIEPN